MSYRDPGRPVEDRVTDLLGRMTLPEKAGLLFHTMMKACVDGLHEPAGDGDDLPPDVLSTRTLVVDKHITHFNAAPRIPPRAYAEWHNRLQDLAAQTRLGVPVTLSSDPVHGFVDNPATSLATTTFSRWPEPLGFAAVGDPDLVTEYAETVRREYLAAGIRMSLGPQADLATEPRWSRLPGTFGADADLAARLVFAYVRGLQGPVVGAGSVACMTKHFPGAGPQRRGEDAHFPYGKEQVYPGGNAEYHLKPFEAAFDAGTAAVMPYYAIPVGLAGVPEIGFGFNEPIVSGWLRERYGYDGVVCSDWGLVTDVRVEGTRWPARCWGAEGLSRVDRVHAALAAGVDQLGGESCPELVVRLVEEGRLSEDRVDASARRVLRLKFALGLFEDPYVDPDRAEEIVGNATATAAGVRAQQRAVTILTNGILPLRRDATFAVVRMGTPHEHRDTGIDYEAGFHQGRLDLSPTRVKDLVEQFKRTPTVLVVNLDRGAVLPELFAAAATSIVDFGITDEALRPVLYGETAPEGRLPFDLPSSMREVEASREDVPNDTPNPVFRAGHGLAL
jgi:beta-glucosidase